MFRPPVAVRQPVHRVVLVEIFRVLRYEFHGLGPKLWNGLRCIIKVDGEAVGLVMVGHVPEDIVVDVAEEMHLRLNAPVILHVFECRMFVEEAAVPSAHLVVGFHAAVLDVVFLEDLGRFFEKLHIDPRGDRPVFLRY